MIGPTFFNPVSSAANEYVTLYSVSKDAYHREDIALLGEGIPARVVSEIDKSRMYRPDKARADTTIYAFVAYISASDAGEAVLEALKIGDIVVINNEEYRIVDIYKGYHLSGQIAHVKLVLA